jgi:hypothetical protein
VLQAGRSRVGFPMVSLEYFIHIILPIALWPCGSSRDTQASSEKCNQDLDYGSTSSYLEGCTRTRTWQVFLSGRCKKRTEDLLKLSRHQFRMVVAILTGHAPVRTHLRTMGLFEGDAVCRFCGQQAETVQHIICRCEATARRRFNVLGDSVVLHKVISIATVRDVCLFIRSIRLLNLCWSGILRVAQ